MLINMGEENITKEFRLKNIEQIKNYFITKINQNELISKNKKFVWFNIKLNSCLL